jgi:hypothetical protein
MFHVCQDAPQLAAGFFTIRLSAMITLEHLMGDIFSILVQKVF